MQLVTLHDDVEITLTKNQEINFKMINIGEDIPNEKNIAYIAAQKFYENLDKTYLCIKTRSDITITKNIPMAAGLAGGSADAAAVLRGLNKIYAKPYTNEQLMEMAKELGSDVPFCLIGGAKVCKNKGDIALDINGLRNFRILIAIDGEKESTAKQYQKLDEKFNNFIDYPINLQFSETVNALTNLEGRRALTSMYNVFETLYDENSSVQRIKKLLYENQARFAMLTGSGPAVFAAFDNIFWLEDAQEILEKEGIKCYQCDLINLDYEYLIPGRKPTAIVF
jgi:4-diphosphocytidyl-2-C-methyl-D-erythritol kinase